jgi:dihydrodipicolinate synthase/N-acetylneuraminate lyase
MKELLVMQGVFPNAVVRPPLLPIGATERDDLESLARTAGLIPRTPPRRNA